MSTRKPLSLCWEGLGPVVPVPAAYIDEIMPALTDTEWRVLVVVIRQTLGWREGMESLLRKQRDWITHSQLKAKTGKSGDSISRAIASLVGYGLILVETEERVLLNEAGERKRARAKLYYRLGDIAPFTGKGGL